MSREEGAEMAKTIERAKITLPPLPETDDVMRREFLIGAAGLPLPLAGCDGDGSGEDEGRGIQRELGETTILGGPGRTVTLSPAETGVSISLGMKAAGAAVAGILDDLQRYLVEWVMRDRGADHDRRSNPERSGFWVLKGPARDFYVCATVRASGPAALCAFDRREAADRHLAGLTEFQMFLDTFDQHGADLPSWVHDESLLPRAREVSRRELAEIAHGIGVGYVALNPPAAGTRIEALEVLPAESFVETSEKERRDMG